MQIVEISGDELLTRTRKALGLPAISTEHIEEPLIASLLRRAAGFLCPCPALTIVSSVAESLDCLAPEREPLLGVIENALDKLVVGGDLLELHQVTTSDPTGKGTWLFAAPPAFVWREASKSAFVIGVAPDEVAPVPDSLKSKIRYDGCVRVISDDSGRNLREELIEYGLVELSEQSWLKSPKAEEASTFRDRIETLLAARPPSGDVVDLQVLNPERDVTFYRGRWNEPKKATGNFVARRPQAYGAPLWGFASLESGQLQRFLDFPLKGSKLRGCDFAWHLQMAIDQTRGSPQRYRKRIVEGGAIFDFFSPLPIWAERRLSVVGDATPPFRSLLSFFVADRDVRTEEEFLHDRLWLTPEVEIPMGL